MTPSVTEELRRLTLFSDLDEPTLADLAPLCEKLTFGNGEILVAQDKEGERDLYLLLSGRVDIVADFVEGERRRQVSLENLDYEMLGEISWLRGCRRSATVRCRGEVEVIRVAGIPFLAYLDAHPLIGYPVIKKMMHIVTRKLQDTSLFLF